jgi:Ca2+-binding RTX toxin-like protein
MTGGPGSDTFTFIAGHSGGTDLVKDFTSKDKIHLEGYGANAVTKALQTQTFAHGVLSITLSDHTKITFQGVEGLKPTNFG